MDTAADVLELITQCYMDSGVIKVAKMDESPRKSLKISTDLEVDPLARSRGIATSYRSLVQVMTFVVIAIALVLVLRLEFRLSRIFCFNT
jgi:hypothetical protein